MDKLVRNGMIIGGIWGAVSGYGLILVGAATGFQIPRILLILPFLPAYPGIFALNPLLGTAGVANPQLGAVLLLLELFIIPIFVGAILGAGIARIIRLAGKKQ